MAPADFHVLRRLAQISHSAAHPLPQEPNYDANIIQATIELRRRLMDEELALSELNSRRTIPDDATQSPSERLRRAKAETAARIASSQVVDYLPPPDSPLNILLAIRSVQRVIQQARGLIPVAEKRLESLEAQIKAEEAGLEEQTDLAKALRKRLEDRLGEGQKPDIGSDAIKDMYKRRNEFKKKSSRLLKELLAFLKNGGLARMIAAEDMGGPVVGEDLEVTLTTGFDKRGRAKKGDRKIDEMWGQGPEERMADEFKTLLEELMNASLETVPYVQLKKDGAAARFLVRAKVAAFHPGDARKLKLLDFGSTVEDE